MTTIQLDTPDGPMPAALAEPAGAPRGGIVVIQEAFGLTDHIAEVASRLAEAGWLAIAPAMFHRQGAPVLDYGAPMDQVLAGLDQLTGEGITMDVDAALAELARRGIPAERTGIVGFCLGGMVSFATAARCPIGAAVTYYGGGVTQGRFGLPSLLEQAPALKAPWLGLYGDEDQGIPVDQVELLRTAVKAADVETEVVRYPGAGHGFNCDPRPSFHAASAADAWTRTLAWFDRFLDATG